jgi:peptidoglycan hydrolase CwlO-like protein
MLEKRSRRHTLSGGGRCANYKERRYMMTIELSTAIIISVLSLGFSVYMGLKNNKRTDTKDVEERVKENTRINMKLDAISNNTTDIKNEVSEMRKEINSHDNRIIKVEESVKSAHHRIDGIENRLNDDKEV